MEFRFQSFMTSITKYITNRSKSVVGYLVTYAYDYPTIIIRLYLATVDLSEAYHNIA